MTTYKGFKISLDAEDGYYWDHGGYSETIGEIESEINRWIQQDQQSDPMYFEHGYDSPALDQPWWEQR